TIFAMEPGLDDRGLRQVLETVLVKSLDERAVFDRVYRRWLDITDRHIAGREQAVASENKAAAKKAGAREKSVLFSLQELRDLDHDRGAKRQHARAGEDELRLEEDHSSARDREELERRMAEMRAAET